MSNNRNPNNINKPPQERKGKVPKKNNLIFLFLGLAFFFLIFISDFGTNKLKNISYSKFISYTNGLYKIEKKDVLTKKPPVALIAELVKSSPKENVYQVVNEDYKIIINDQNKKNYLVSLYRKVSAVNVRNNSLLQGILVDENNHSEKFLTSIPENSHILDILPKKGINVNILTKDDNNSVFNSLIGILPWVLMIFFIWFFFIRQVNNSNNKAFSFGKSRARLYQQDKEKTTFNDVAGCKEAKKELSEVVDFLKNPEKYLKMGAKIPKGILLSGPPGIGKTLLAKAVAGEANRPFFSISASEFVEMFVGVGASRVRDLFSTAKKNTPCIVFIDELDAIGRMRGIGTGGGNDEKEQTLNQILSEMDGFEKDSTVIVLAATNRPDVLDSALLRPGRFDRQIHLESPSEEDRLEILKLHSKNKPLSPDVDFKELAKDLSGFSGAEIANLINESILIATRKNKKLVDREDIKEAQSKSVKQKNNPSTDPPTLFGRNRAKFYEKGSKQSKTFADVAGAYEAKEELEEVVDFLKNPQRYQKLGARIPKGILLTGPPGTGKTLLAKAVAGEADRPFFSASGSDFVEMYVGVGASRVRDLFNNAKKNAPCIIFIDEIDAVGKKRGGQFGGGNDEKDQTLNQILTEMDGFDSIETVIVLASTNRADILDNALLRPGRFDRQISVEKPDVRAREDILKVHAKNKPLEESVDLRDIARGTVGFSGAELENLLNEAALIAAKNRKNKTISIENIQDAKDKVLMGPEKRNIIMLQKEKINTAYHEAAHAIVAHYLKDTDPVHKVTIIPRGRALGVTQQIPIDDKKGYTKAYILNRIAILMAGRIGEETKFGADQITTGASNDIEVATQMAQGYVTRFGMSESLGMVHYNSSEMQGPSYSQETAKMIDMEVKKVIDTQYKVAQDLLKKYDDKLTEMSLMLLEKETIDEKDVENLLGKKVGVEELRKEVDDEYQKMIARKQKKDEENAQDLLEENEEKLALSEKENPEPSLEKIDLPEQNVDADENTEEPSSENSSSDNSKSDDTE